MFTLHTIVCIVHLSAHAVKGKCAVQPSLCCECIIIRMHLGAVKEGNHAVQPCLYVNE